MKTLPAGIEVDPLGQLIMGGFAQDRANVDPDALADDDDERELPPGVFDARHLAGKHNQKTHGHGGGTAVADRPSKWQRHEGKLPDSGERVVTYTNGSHTVMDFSSGFSRDEIEGTILPTLDRLMEKNPVKGIVDVRLMPKVMHKGQEAMGVTINGKGKIQVSGKAAGQVAPDNGFNISEGSQVKASEYILVHEWGHAMDPPANARRDRMALKFGGRQPSQYARSSRYEAFAENFAKFELSGGKTTNSVTQAYAEEFGWKA